VGKGFSRGVVAAACVVIVGLGAAFTLATSVGGVGRHGVFGHHDLVYFAGAGAAWFRGDSPYIQEELLGAVESLFAGSGEPAPALTSSFAYPPHVFPFTAVAAAGGLGTGAWLFAALNLACLGVLGLAAHRCFRETYRGPEGAWRSLLGSVVVAVAVGSPFASHNIWMGQTSLISAGLLAGGWVLCSSGRAWAGCALIGLASFKPHLAVAVIPLAVLRWPVQSLVMMTGSVCLAAGYPLVRVGVIETVSDWFDALGRYGSSRQAAVTFRHAFGVKSLLVSAGFGPLPVAAVGGVLIALIAGLWRRVDNWNLLGLALLVPVLFVKAHDYDLVVVAVPVACLLGLYGSSRFAVVLLLAVVGAVFVPLRLVMRVDAAEWVYRYREIGVLVLFCVHAATVLQRRSGGGGAAS
jgi:hypothetical protein